jgi:hypothetical protein
MAIINAANNGNWSNASTWPSSIFPTSADDVYANNRTIYIDTDITINSLNTTTGDGGVAGGRFYANQGDIVINSNTIKAGTTYCVTVTGTGTRTISAQWIQGSDTTTTTAAVLILGTLGLPNVITYGNAIGGLAAGGAAASHPAGITIEGGMLTHYGFVSGGQAAQRSSGIKVYQGANSTIPVSAIIYGDVKGGNQALNAGIVCEYSPSATTLSSCLISVYGNLSGGDSLLTGTTNNVGLYTISTIPINILGNLHGGSGYSYTNGGIRWDGGVSREINIVGNIYNHPNFGFSPGLFGSSSTGTVNITGDIVCLDPFIGAIASNSLGAPSMYINSGGATINISGNVYACQGTRNFGGVGVWTEGTNNTTTINIYGNVYGGNSGNAYGIYSTGTNSNGIVNVYGNVYGSSADGAINGFGAYVASTGFVNVYGSAIAGDGIGSHAVWNNFTSHIYAKRAVANSFGLGSAEAAYNQGYGLISINISGRNLVEEMVFGPRAQIPVYGPTFIVNTTTNSVTGRRLSLDSAITDLKSTVLVDESILETFLPSASDVVNNTVYNNTLTGTMIVPPASSVSFNIPVNNTIGTAYVTPNEIWNTQTTELTSLSTIIGYRLKNVATIESVGNILASYNI